MKCRICGNESKYIFNAKIMGKYNVNYFYCNNCGFLGTQNFFWLDEAYSEAISTIDTGVLLRNLYLRDVASIVIYFVFDDSKKFLDYAGGYGVFTRLMRDIGFDFYWDDLYSKNLFSRGFEYNKKDKIELITTFESFEHFVDPIKEIENMLSMSTNIIFSTEILPYPIPKPDEWWYYSLSAGQHISFYSIKTLNFLANKYNLMYYTIGNIHIFTKKRINKLTLMYLKMIDKFFLLRLISYNYIKTKMKTKTVDDMNKIISRSIRY